MSIREKLARTEYGADAFVSMYEDEIAKMTSYEKDLSHFDQMELEDKREFELDARAYYRKFARIFYEASDGRVTKDLALPFMERREELQEEFMTIQEMEDEKARIEHEIHVQDLEEQELNRKIQTYHDKMNNQWVLCLSTSVMLMLAVVFTGIAVWQFHILLSLILWPAIAIVVVAVTVIIFLYRGHKKSLSKEKTFAMVKTNKRIVSNRLQMDYESQCRKLGFYYEKYDTIFSYITEEQWKLFGFCAKVFEVVDSSEELQHEREKFIEILKNYGFDYPDMWCCYTRALYDRNKRESLLAQWEERIAVCKQGIEKHKR